MIQPGCDVREATHVKYNGMWHRIASKSGISSEGRLAKPSEGGFSVTTLDGRRITMWEAEAYGKDDKPRNARSASA